MIFDVIDALVIHLVETYKIYFFIYLSWLLLQNELLLRQLYVELKSSLRSLWRKRTHTIDFNVF